MRISSPIKPGISQILKTYHFCNTLASLIPAPVKNTWSVWAVVLPWDNQLVSKGLSVKAMGGFRNTTFGIIFLGVISSLIATYIWESGHPRNAEQSNEQSSKAPTSSKSAGPGETRPSQIARGSEEQQTGKAVERQSASLKEESGEPGARTVASPSEKNQNGLLAAVEAKDPLNGDGVLPVYWKSLVSGKRYEIHTKPSGLHGEAILLDHERQVGSSESLELREGSWIKGVPWLVARPGSYTGTYRVVAAQYDHNQLHRCSFEFVMDAVIPSPSRIEGLILWPNANSNKKVNFKNCTWSKDLVWQKFILIPE